MSNADTALVITDPQNDFLSPDGVTWELVGKSVEANSTVENIENAQSGSGTNTYSEHGVSFEYPGELRAAEFGVFTEDANRFNGVVTAAAPDASTYFSVSWLPAGPEITRADLQAMLEDSFESGFDEGGPTGGQGSIAEASSHGGLLLYQSWSQPHQGDQGFGVAGTTECESDERAVLLSVLRAQSAGGSPERVQADFQSLVDSLHC